MYKDVKMRENMTGQSYKNVKRASSDLAKGHTNGMKKPSPDRLKSAVDRKTISEIKTSAEKHQPALLNSREKLEMSEDQVVLELLKSTAVIHLVDIYEELMKKAMKEEDAATLDLVDVSASVMEKIISDGFFKITRKYNMAELRKHINNELDVPYGTVSGRCDEYGIKVKSIEQLEAECLTVLTICVNK